MGTVWGFVVPVPTWLRITAKRQSGIHTEQRGLTSEMLSIVRNPHKYILELCGKFPRKVVDIVNAKGEPIMSLKPTY